MHKIRINRFHFGLGVFAMIAIAAGGALAQETALLGGEAGPDTIDIGVILDWIIAAIAAVLGPVALFVVMKFAKKLGIDIEANDRAALDQALKAGIGMGAELMKDKAAQFQHVTVRNALIKMAANYAIGATPEAIKRFKLTPADIEDRVAARLGTILEDTAAATGNIPDPAPEP